MTKKLITKRLKIVIGFILVAGLVVGIYAYQVRRSKRSLDDQISNYMQTIDQLQKEVTFGDFSTQNVDDYIANLNKEIKMLDSKLAITKIITNNPQFYSDKDLVQAGIDISKTQTEKVRYELDREFMATAWIDYNLLRLNPNLVDSYNFLVRNYAELNFDLANAKQTSSNAPGRYVHQGEIIGLQGCTGVCSGTHIHFAMYIDDQAVDPCNYLPVRELSRWGVDATCGVNKSKANLAWPTWMTWIVTQNFSDVSPITHTVHGATDLIDREFIPVLAAHDGWIKTEMKKCTGASICNNGAANIVTICSNQDCKKSVRTEYWHLDWFVE